MKKNFIFRKNYLSVILIIILMIFSNCLEELKDMEIEEDFVFPTIDATPILDSKYEIVDMDGSKEDIIFNPFTKEELSPIAYPDGDSFVPNARQGMAELFIDYYTELVNDYESVINPTGYTLRNSELDCNNEECDPISIMRLQG